MPLFFFGKKKFYVILVLMKTAYIFHDAFNDQFSDWYPWMKNELEKLGYVTFVPQFPTPAGQSYESWRTVMKNYLHTFDGETIFIGHGTGGAFALRLVEELPQKIRGLFLIASYAEPIGHVGYDRLNEPFVNHEFNWEKIIANTVSRGVIAGESDPFVPLEITQHLANHLNETVVVIPEGGHIHKASGFVHAVAVLQIIIEIMQSIDKSITIESVNESVSESESTNQALLLQQSMTQDTAIQPVSETSDQKPNPAIHTMYEDMSQLVSSKKGSVISSLLTETRATETIRKENSPLFWKNILYISGTSILILTGLGVVGYVFYQFLPAQQQIVIPKPESLLPAETYSTIDITEKESFETQSAITTTLETKGTENTLHDIIYLEQGARITIARLLEYLNIPSFPNILKDQFGITSNDNRPLFMHAVVKHNSTTRHAVIVPFISYDTLFIGMKEWEPTLVRDMGVFFGISPEILGTLTSITVFNDEVIENKNIRVYRDQENNFVLGYFFLNQKTIVFIDDPELISFIVKRFANREIYN